MRANDFHKIASLIFKLLQAIRQVNLLSLELLLFGFRFLIGTIEFLLCLRFLGLHFAFYRLHFLCPHTVQFFYFLFVICEEGLLFEKQLCFSPGHCHQLSLQSSILFEQTQGFILCFLDLTAHPILDGLDPFLIRCAKLHSIRFVLLVQVLVRLNGSLLSFLLPCGFELLLLS